MIKRIYFRDIEHMIPEMEKEGILVSRNVDIFGYYHGNTLCGIAGVKTGHNAYFKMAYTIPSMRKQGIFKKLLEHRIAYAKKTGSKKGHANCTKMSLNTHLSFGGIVSKKYKNGIYRVEYEIL